MNVKDLLSLKNKVVLITGGEGRYGRCILEGLLEADCFPSAEVAQVNAFG